MIRSTPALALAAAMLLSACAGGSETSSTQAAQLQTILATAQASRATPPDLPPPTPEFVASLPVAALEVVVESRDATAYMVKIAERTDARPGRIQTWQTSSGAQLILRDGVLIATRGLGNDLGSSRVTAAVQSVNTASPVSGPHNMFVKGYDNNTTRIDLDCEMESLGQTRIEIVERQHNVLHLRQNCTSPGGDVTNEFWVGTSDRAVWQSRQWVGPELGYIRIRLLKK